MSTNTLSVSEVASILDVTDKVVYHLIYDLELDSIKEGRRLKVTPEALDEYIEFAA
jgi:excisionase family DNA binding protein